MSTPLSPAALDALRQSATQCCTLLKAMAQEDRLLLLCQLIEGEHNVGELEAAVGLHQPSLSQHLGVLREEGLVSARREGKYMYYSLASVEVLSIMKTLSNLYCGKVKGRLK
ncbi:transcriptional regulator (plasmid) [Paraburkholderia sp. PGU19]|uniref:ArsR/SmtB family transcription factor n=1 Tax=Paraburkholderia sp. PGU19 TaxID=2735434 RepID=UPI0015D99094|nr:metalloregulator ArsR/SmtB family transcription factor [Paraburkholderia sp. PGU19]BCG03536.1 transcriptional regulator [Paraburkholderia sp. PGU19]